MDGPPRSGGMLLNFAYEEPLMPFAPQTSIVIPVYNKWELTRDCLESLAKTLPPGCCEVVVVDNASTDATFEACPAMGRKLFGDGFIYHRAEQNLNFGPASNLGARLGRGEYVLFLNNDTVALSGWYDPLVRDFTDYKDVAATGPVLMYPSGSPLGDTVQHLGVFVNPTLKVGHLYEGIPAESALAKKRRFFQIITAACLLMPRALFLKYGGFDEAYINGFEDVDLCCRLWADGYRMTVNPDSRLYHLTSQTPGRHSHELENSLHFSATSMRHLAPDWHIHLKNDGLELQITPWQTISPGMSEVQAGRLAPLLQENDPSALVTVLARNPLWYAGYDRLTQLLEARGYAEAAHSVRLSHSKLRPLPEQLFAVLDSSMRLKDPQSVNYALDNLFQYCFAFEKYETSALAMREWAEDLGLPALAESYRQWSAGAEAFRQKLFQPFLREMRGIMRNNRPSVLTNWAYTMWRELLDLPRRAAAKPLSLPAGSEPPRFSVLMPVYNPLPEHLRAAVDSLLKQSWPHWELCLADDASPDPQIRPLLEELAALDSRIRVEYRPVNGHIAAATNTALAVARFEYVALMDQDDLLTPDALEAMAGAILEHPDAALLYSDEDKLFEDGNISYPYFKGHWDRELLTGQNMVNHLSVYRTERLRRIGGFREGFSGAQDYDMLLRFTKDLPDSAVVRVPQVLYHWRSHSGSTAANIQEKSYVLESSVKALQDHLDETYPGAKAGLVPDTQFLRAIYPLPQPAPLISLIIDLGADPPLGPAMPQALAAKAGYSKLEILLLYDAQADERAKLKLIRWAGEQRQVRLLAMDRALTSAERANAAASEARGALLGFIGKGVIPLTQGWLGEVVSRLARTGMGCLGGKLLDGHNRVQHAGHAVSAGGKLFSLFRGLPHEEPGYFAWAKLARTVPSVDPRCLFTHKKYVEESGGFDSATGQACLIDFCLRLGEKGLRAVITPFAEFALTLGADVPWENECKVAEERFLERWSGKLAPCNANLEIGDIDWTLYWNGTTEQGTSCVQAYSSVVSTDYSLERELPILFDAAWYGRRYLKRDASYKEAMEHYVSDGRFLNYQPHPLFFPEYYLNQLPQNEIVMDNILFHYIKNGAASGYSPCPLFTPSWYADEYDISGAGLTPLGHYISIGAPEGRAPNKFFDARQYEARHKSEIAPYGYALLHYLHTASHTLYNPSSRFITKDYLDYYPDVKAAAINPLLHYLHYGLKEQRVTSITSIDYSGVSPEILKNLHSVPKGGVVVCLALAGDYSRLLPPAYINPSWRYVCFSDLPREGWGVWEIHPMPFEDPDPTRRARYCKLHLPWLFPEAELVIWVDGNVIIMNALDPLISAFNASAAPVGLIPHPDRNCIYDEAEACVEGDKDNPDSIARQVEHYRDLGYPTAAGLFETNVMLVNPKHQQSGRLFERWWEELRTHSRRDQLSLPFVLRELGITPHLLMPQGICVRNHPDFTLLFHRETRFITVPKYFMDESAK